DADARGAGSLQREFDSARLAAFSYQPQDAEEPAVEGETEPLAAKAGSGSGEQRRRREQQILHTITSLATQADLARAIDGRSLTSSTPGARREDIAEIVHTTFARSLGKSVDEVVAGDQLEVLGCDSFRI